MVTGRRSWTRGGALSALLLLANGGTTGAAGIVPVERPEPGRPASPAVEAIDLAGGTLLDIEPAGGSGASHLTPVGDTLFFSATRDGRTTLWRTDGTAGGTVEVSRRPDLTCDLDDFCNYFGVQLLPAGRGLFVLTEAGLWHTDGTELGTISLGVGPIGQSAAVGDGLFFITTDYAFAPSARARGTELWHSDGTAAGTRITRDILPGRTGGVCPDRGGDFCLDGSAPVVSVGDRVVFPADDGRHGYEPWVSDGTAAGTRLLRNIGPDAGGDSAVRGGACVQPRSDVFCQLWFRPAARGALFWARDEQHGAEPWWTDGTPSGTHLVADLRRGSAGSVPGWPGGALGERVLFLADVGRGMRLWVTDGSRRGTRLLLGGRRGRGSACRPTCSLEPLDGGMMVAGDRAYLGLVGPGARPELWVTDGSVAGTTRVTELVPDADGWPRLLMAAAGPLPVFISRDASGSTAVWTTDGTPGGTHRLTTIETRQTPDDACEDACDQGNVTEAVVAGGRLVLSLDDGKHGRELWVVPLPSRAAMAAACDVRQERTGVRSTDLADAVAASVDGDVLTVSGRCDGGITIDRDLTIQGDGPGRAVISGLHRGPALTVAEDAAVVLRDLDVADGAVDGGVVNAGTLTLERVTVRDSEGGEGGGIWSSGPLTLVDSTVRDNGAADGGGGGIALAGERAVLSATRTVVRDNRAAFGGGLFLSGYATARLDHSVIARNRATNDGGGIDAEAGMLEVVASTVRGNRAGHGGGISSSEGGVAVRDSRIEGNHAAGRGGGLQVGPTSQLEVAGSTVRGNTAWNGGGIWAATTVAIEDSWITGNRAANDGGGMLVRTPPGLGPRDATEVSLQRTRFVGNRAGGAGDGYRLVGDVEIHGCPVGRQC